MTPLRGMGTTVLVVDDDALITLNTADILKEHGLNPIEAFSGHEALAIVQQRPDIQAIVTDFSMPGMTGIELAEAARQLRPDLLVLLTTGYAELPEEASGSFKWLEKPYREDELIACLGQLLSASAE